MLTIKGEFPNASFAYSALGRLKKAGFYQLEMLGDKVVRASCIPTCDEMVRVVQAMGHCKISVDGPKVVAETISYDVDGRETARRPIDGRMDHVVYELVREMGYRRNAKICVVVDNS